MDVLDSFVADCLAIVDQPDAGDRVAAALQPLVADPARLTAEIDARRPEGGGAVIVHRSDELTVLGLDVAAGFVSPAHNHTIWAVVGIYDGNEDNVFYRRTPGGIEETGRAVLHTGECLALPSDAVHRIANSGGATMKALHVYGGDLFATSRSQWDDETGEELPFGTRR
jgi:predicted metal-dependent enzyme (double-stranded beta helix superfamily)